MICPTCNYCERKMTLFRPKDFDEFYLLYRCLCRATEKRPTFGLYYYKPKQ